MSEPTLDYAAVRAWLTSKNRRAFVGFRDNPCDCPLARYLAEHGAPAPMVTGAAYYLNVEDEEEPRRREWTWAAHFVAAVDNSGESDTGITAAAALRLLERCAPRPKP